MQLPEHITMRLVRLDDEDLPPWQDLLADYECERLETFKSLKRRRMFVQGRVAARLLLAEQLRVEPPNVPLRLRADGSPFVDGNDVRVSIGHAGCYGVAAVAPVPVGVDIEEVKSRNPDLYRFLLAEDDYGVLETLPVDHDRRQVLLWTLKESVLKGGGTGLRLSPKKIRLSVDYENGSARATLEERTWAVQFKEHQGFYVSVAYES